MICYSTSLKKKPHCYVVVEVKIKEYKSRDKGHLGTYINIVDEIVKMGFTMEKLLA